jgi:hypothetical protein
MHLSQHAIQRCEQRGVSEAMIDIIVRFGSVEYHRGNEIVRLDKRGVGRAQQYLGGLYKGSREQLQSCYVVVRDGTVVTVARQTRHHKRDRH